METTAVVPSLNTYSLSAFIGYLILITTIGVVSSKFSSRGMSEYFLAGRSLNRFVVALSAVVSGRSAWLLIGFTGMAYKMGAPAVWAAVGYITVEFFLFMFYASRLRRFSEAYNCLTLPDFYAARFRDRSGVLRILLSSIIIIFMVSYVSAQFVGGGKAFSASFGMSNHSGMLLTAMIVLLYTLLGGFLAVSLTDVMQAFFMIVALLLLPIVIIHDLGGLGIMLETLKTIKPGLIDPFAIGIGAMIGFIGIGLGSPGNPHILVRYMSISDPSQLRWSAFVGTVWNVFMAGSALLIGLAGRSIFPEASAIPGGDTEQLYPLLAIQYLHPILFGIVIASIFAAIMSTADSQLLVAASSLVHDFYVKVLKRGEEVEDTKLVLFSRIGVVILVILSLIIGLAASKLVFWLVLFAWAGLGASIGPTSILALFWKRTTIYGVIAGLISGTVTTILWYNTPILKKAIYELIPAFGIGLVVTVFVSLLTTPPEEVDDMFEKMS